MSLGWNPDQDIAAVPYQAAQAAILTTQDQDQVPFPVELVERLRAFRCGSDNPKTLFTQTIECSIQVYDLGEGEGGDMYDFAWIENDRDRVVWEMTLRNTERAGGARKNRLFNDTVSLEAGEYTVHYESDGSHSFAGWNADPPRDSWSWGVTVRAAD